MESWFQKQWAGFTCWHILLVPLSWLFGTIVLLRRLLYSSGLLKSYHLKVPVIVVGNINIGGTGKTPLVIWLVEQLKLAGYKPGVISRGYGGNTAGVTQVSADSNPEQAGDEAVLIAMRTGSPVFVSPNRVDAARGLLNAYPECDVVISDDGLQHYRLQRDIEIAVYDAVKGFGNGALLPAGPLREPVSRLQIVDAVVSNGSVAGSSKNKFESVEMQLQAADFYNLADSQIKTDGADFSQQKILAVAGIGNPARFFEQLARMGLNFASRAFADHHAYTAEDFERIDADVVLMTEKDAVKCRAFAKPNFWVLPVNAVVQGGLMPIVLNKLNSKEY